MDEQASSRDGKAADFNNSSVLQPTTTYLTHLDAPAIAANTDPSSCENGHYGDVQLGAGVRGRECIPSTG